jgi:vacuolar protein sorting-associated protein 13A/C
LGKEPVIVLIDRVFVLANPAPDSRTMKVQKYSDCGLINYLINAFIFCLIELIFLLQEEDREKLFQDKLQQIEVRVYATCVKISYLTFILRKVY